MYVSAALLTKQRLQTYTWPSLNFFLYFLTVCLFLPASDAACWPVDTRCSLLKGVCCNNFVNNFNNNSQQIQSHLQHYKATHCKYRKGGVIRNFFVFLRVLPRIWLIPNFSFLNSVWSGAFFWLRRVFLWVLLFSAFFPDLACTSGGIPRFNLRFCCFLVGIWAESV